MFLLFTLLFACSEKPSEAPPMPANSEPSKPAAFDPLAGKSIKEICSSNGLSLIKWSYQDRQSKHQELCCGKGGFPKGSDECMYDWPSSDVPSCSMYDEMRNEIYAQYGRSFKTKKWRKYFAAKDWYQVRNDYTDKWLSSVAHANVKKLKAMKAKKVNCMD